MANTKSRQQTSREKEEKRLAVLESQKAKEKAFKLVVKIISWESGALESIVIKSANKITADEWLQYKRHRLNISNPQGMEKMRDDLTQTYNLIKANGGFE